MSDEREQARQKPRAEQPKQPDPEAKVPEIGGPKGLEPTRYGDWERAGRCIDF